MNEGRKRRKQEWNREQILEAARRLAAQGGKGALTVRQVAEQAGVAPSVLYYYFENSQQILEAVCRQAGEEAAETVQRAVQENWDFAENFSAAWRALLELAWQRPGEYQMLSQLTREQGQSDGLILLEEQLRRATAAGQIRAGNPQRLASSVWTAVQALICRLCAQGGELEAAQAQLEEFLAILLRGMAPERGNWEEKE